jgi:purine-binding chemotaxis protein CheW
MNELPCHGFCTFMVGDSCFAVPADGVVEVLRGGRLARVPLAPDAILGLLHLRGRIVPVIDPATHLGISRKTPENHTHLVIELQDDWYGLVIDEMLDVVEIPRDRIEQPTTFSAEGPAEAVAGVFAAPDRLVHLLDPQRMIQSFVRQRPQTHERQASSHGRS